MPLTSPSSSETADQSMPGAGRRPPIPRARTYGPNEPVGRPMVALVGSAVAAPVLTQPAPVDERIGMEIGKYIVTRRLGGGGMGVVYEASDKVLRRQVAIKFFAEAVTVTRDTVKRFVREAQAAARLNHPNVVSVFEVGRRDGVYFLVMELVAGGSAEERLRKHGKFDWAEATRLTADACRGLGAAHAASMIHRDIKPANLLLNARLGGRTSTQWEVKVGDFGLAKLTDGGASMATAADRVMGTPHYMSPEQCRSEALDPRTDLYSLGATYFSLLTGRLPFAGESPMQVMFAHCWTATPDPRQVDPSIPAACANIVRRAMCKEARGRYRTAQEMLVDLELALADPSGGSMTQSPDAAVPGEAREPREPMVSRSFDPALSMIPEMPLRRDAQMTTDAAEGVSSRRPGTTQRGWRRRPLLTISLGLLLAAGVAAGAFVWQRGGLRNAVNAIEVSPGSDAPIPQVHEARWAFDNGGSISALLFSPNSRKLVAGASDGDGGMRGWDMLDGRPCLLVSGKQPCSGAAFTGDPIGQTLYYGSAGTVMQWSLVQEAARNAPMPVGGDIWSVSRSSDGRLLAALARQPGLNQHPFVKLFDSREREIPFPVENGRDVLAVSFLGQTSLLATGGPDAALHIWDSSQLTQYMGVKALIRSIDVGVVVASIAASESGNVIAVGGRKSAQFIDINGRKLGRAYCGERNVRCLAISPNGTLAAIGSGTDTTPGTVIVYAVPGGQPVAELKGHTGAVSRVAFSPDGKLLATGGLDHTVKVWDVSRLPTQVGTPAVAYSMDRRP